MTHGAISSVLLVLTTLHSSTGGMFPSSINDIHLNRLVVAVDNVIKTQACMQDILQDLDVNTKGGEDVEKLNNEIQEQREYIEESKQREIQLAEYVKQLSVVLHSHGQKLEMAEKREVQLTEDVKQLNDKLQEQRENVVESRQREIQLTGDVQKLKDVIQEQREYIEESKQRDIQLAENVKQLNVVLHSHGQKLEMAEKREVQLTEDVKQLNDKVEFLNSVTEEEASKIRERQANITKLVQVLETYRLGTSLGRDLVKLLDGDTVASTQLDVVLHSDSYPLWLMGSKGYVELASLLLSGGFPVDKELSPFGNNMLHLAAHGGHLQLASLALLHGADVDDKSSMVGTTPLMLAAAGGQLEMAKYLMRAGADVSVQKNNGKTALDIARFYNRTDIIKFLESL